MTFKQICLFDLTIDGRLTKTSNFKLKKKWGMFGAKTGLPLTMESAHFRSEKGTILGAKEGFSEWVKIAKK